MSAIKIRHFKDDTLSQSLRDELDQISSGAMRLYTVEHGAELDRSHHYFVINSEHTLFGFAIFSTLDGVATIHTTFIKEAYRRKSLGKKLVLHLLSKTVKEQCHKVELECDASSLDFFKHLGFITTKEPNERKGISLYSLENNCPDYFMSVYRKGQIESQSSTSKTQNSLILSKDDSLYNYHDEEEFIALHRNMLSQAKRRIWIVADTINSPVLSDELFSRSILQLAKNNSQAEIRILLADDKTGAGHFNSLVNLAQRLSSFVEIRTIEKSSSKLSEMLTVVDFSAGIYRKNLQSYSGFATYNNPLIAKRLQDKYETHWQYAKASLEFRRLAI